MNDHVLRQLFRQCKEKSRFIFEVCPIFGDELTLEEMEYWFVYDIITSAHVYDVNIEDMSFENAIEEIDEAISKRKSQWKTKSKRGSSQRRIS